MWLAKHSLSCWAEQWVDLTLNFLAMARVFRVSWGRDVKPGYRKLFATYRCLANGSRAFGDEKQFTNQAK